MRGIQEIVLYSKIAARHWKIVFFLDEFILSLDSNY